MGHSFIFGQSPQGHIWGSAQGAQAPPSALLALQLLNYQQFLVPNGQAEDFTFYISSMHSGNTTATYSNL